MSGKPADLVDTSAMAVEQLCAHDQQSRTEPTSTVATIGSQSRVAAIILAAGASTRLGEPKQLVTLGGERLLERAVRVAHEAGCLPIVVVLGALAAEIAGKCLLAHAQIVLNESWRLGLASSIRAGLAHLDSTVEAAVVMTCDQPAVSASHLRRLMAAGTQQAMASSYAGRYGVPACFPAHCFASLRSLNGDAGARDLLRNARAIDLPGGALDIDTPDALLAARAEYE